MFGSRTSNSVSRFEIITNKNYRWKSSAQAFVYWDSEKNEEVALPEKAVLVPLTATNSVTGTHEVDHGKATRRFNAVYSNEFTDFREEIVKVQEKDKLDGTKTIIAEGPYTPVIKEAIADKSWANFTKNIYCLCDGEVVKVSLRGSSLTPWIKFEGEIRDKNIDFMHGHGFQIVGTTAERNGAVQFTSPVYGIVDINSEVEALANTKADEVEAAILRNKQGALDATVETSTTAPLPPAQTPAHEDDSISLEDIPF